MDNSTTWKLLDKYFHDNPQSLVRHHTESYNDFFQNGIFQIFKEKNPLRIRTKYDERINDYRSQCTMYFGGKEGNKVYFGKPVIYDDDNSHYMFPNEARLRNMSYGMTIHYDIEIEYIDRILGKIESDDLPEEEKAIEKANSKSQDTNKPDVVNEIEYLDEQEDRVIIKILNSKKPTIFMKSNNFYKL